MRWLLSPLKLHLLKITLTSKPRTSLIHLIKVTINNRNNWWSPRKTTQRIEKYWKRAASYQLINTEPLRNYWGDKWHTRQIFITIHLRENHLSNLPTSVEEQYEQIIMNSIAKVGKIESETTYGKNIDEIKYDHMKIITSIEMNLPTKNSNKLYSYSEHINAGLITYILLQSPEKWQHFTKHLSSVYLEGNIQLQIRKWWVAIRSERFQYLFDQNIPIPLKKTTIWTTDKLLE